MPSHLHSSCQVGEANSLPCICSRCHDVHEGNLHQAYCNAQSRYENNDSLAVDCPPSVLAPGASQEVSISFSPCEARMYREVLPININALYTVRVSILGEGSPLRLELANPAHRSLNLGAVSRGSQSSKSVQVTPAIMSQHVPHIDTLLQPYTGSQKQRHRPC